MMITATRDGVRAAHVLAPLPDTEPREARLSFDNGLESISLSAGSDAAALLTAEFGQPLPAVWVADWNVHVEYPLGARIFRRHHPSRVRLNPVTPWSLDIHGGASDLAADLTGIDIRSVTMHAGSAQLKFALGPPTGVRTVQVAVVKDLRIVRPAGVAVRLRITKGATNVTMDDRHFGAVGGGLTDHTEGYHVDQPHYEVIIAGAADTVTITSTEA